MEMFLATKNSMLNGRKLEVRYEDGICNGQNAVREINKLVTSDKVQVVLGGLCSGETLAMAPTANQNKVVLFSSGSSSPAIKDAGDYVFRNWPSDEVAAKQTIEDIKENYLSETAPTSFAIISENSDFAQGFKKDALKFATEMGILVAVDETFNPGTTDFKTILGKVKSSDAKALIVNAQTPAGDGLIVKQAAELGIKLPTYASNAVNGTEFFEQGKSATEEVMFYDVALDEERPIVKSFMDEAKAKSINNLTYSATKYDAINIVYNAIVAVGNDGEKIKQYLYNMPLFEGVAGTYKFDSDGEVNIALVKKVVKDGKFVIAK